MKVGEDKLATSVTLGQQACRSPVADSPPSDH
jgi:hypothetical protein